MCGVCIANGEKHHTHAVISTKAAAGDAKAAIEGYVKAAHSFVKEAEGHSQAFSSKLQGPSLHTSTRNDCSPFCLLSDVPLWMVRAE